MTNPVPELTPEELLAKIDARIRSKRTSTAQLLRLQTKREKLLKKMAAEPQNTCNGGRPVYTHGGLTSEEWEYVFQREREMREQTDTLAQPSGKNCEELRQRIEKSMRVAEEHLANQHKHERGPETLKAIEIIADV